MGFRSVPTLVNDLEQRNGPYFVFFLPNSVAFGAHYVLVIQYFLQQKCSPKNLFFSDMSFMALFARDHHQRGR